MSDFTEEELRRYSRQILLDGFGEEGQSRLRDGRVLIVGSGGLGSPAAYYLAAAGVGFIGIADGDRVDTSNLQRQILHNTADLGRLKVESAKEKLTKLNPGVRITAYPERLTPENASDIISPYDFVVEATDSYSTKYLVNDTCVALGKPFCLGGILKLEGQAMTHLPGTACYRCLFPVPPNPEDVPTASQVGVLGSAVGIVGSVQATEVIKYLTGIGRLLTDRLLSVDAATMAFSTVAIRRNPACPICGGR